jgi:recombination protein RecR
MRRTDPRAGMTYGVVERPTDIIPIDAKNRAQGRYHVLGGAISDRRRDAEDLHIRELLTDFARIGEVNLATNLTAEGEATASYLAGVVKPFNVRVTRIAYGMPVGSDLEYTDEVTVGRAIKGRREV